MTDVLGLESAGRLSDDLRGRLEAQGSVPTHGYDLNGRRIMEDTVTTVQVGTDLLTFEEGPFGLECMDLTPEQAAWLVSAPHLRRLLKDALAVIVGWGMMYNEMTGHAPDDVTQYPMATAARLIERAHDLGMEV